MFYIPSSDNANTTILPFYANGRAGNDPITISQRVNIPVVTIPTYSNSRTIPPSGANKEQVQGQTSYLTQAAWRPSASQAKNAHRRVARRLTQAGGEPSQENILTHDTENLFYEAVQGFKNNSDVHIYLARGRNRTLNEISTNYTELHEAVLAS